MEHDCDSRLSTAEAAYSSPPCYAHEFPGYFGDTAALPAPMPAICDGLCQCDIMCPRASRKLVLDISKRRRARDGAAC